MYDITCIPEPVDQSHPPDMPDDGMTACPFCEADINGEHDPDCPHCGGKGIVPDAVFLAWLRGEYDDLEELP